MQANTQRVWSPLRQTLKDCLTFAETKVAAANGGLLIEAISTCKLRQEDAP
jgi:hypothetical protein